MALTYEPIASVTTSSLVTEITISGIPSTYTDLRCVFNGQCNTTGSDFGYRVNGATAANYAQQMVWANDGGSPAYNGAGYFSGAQIYVTALSGTGNLRQTYRSVQTLDIMNYSQTSTSKGMLLTHQVVQFGSNLGAITRQTALWNQTPAISSVQFYTISSVDLQIGSNFTIYGIKRA
jgi:hypothetical protein